MAQYIRKPLTVEAIYSDGREDATAPTWARPHIRNASPKHPRFIVQLPHGVEAMTPDVFARDFAAWPEGV